MAIPKRGSRKIVVDNEVYRWLIRRKATYGQVDYGIGKLNVAIELYEEPKSKLVIFTDRPHPHDYGTKKIIPITPSDIEHWIKCALDLKWKPHEDGPQFQVIIENGLMRTF